jgi:hypothetical protein
MNFGNPTFRGRQVFTELPERLTPPHARIHLRPLAARLFRLPPPLPLLPRIHIDTSQSISIRRCRRQPPSSPHSAIGEAGVQGPVVRSNSHRARHARDPAERDPAVGIAGAGGRLRMQCSPAHVGPSQVHPALFHPYCSY